MVTLRRLALLGVLLTLAHAACGDDDGGGADNDGGAAPASDGTDGGAADDDGSGAVGVCDDLGPDAYLTVELTGDVTESIDWAPEEMDCSGSAVTALTLGWSNDDLDVSLRDIDVATGETGTGLSGSLLVNAGPASYSGDTCTLAITTNEQVTSSSTSWRAPRRAATSPRSAATA